jgi:exosortase
MAITLTARTAAYLRRHRRRLVLLVVCASILWSYWPTLAEMVRRWASDPQYSHGFLVPVFSLFLLWSRRDRLAAAGGRGNCWGLGLVVAGALLRLAGARWYLSWLEGVSLLPVLAGVAVLMRGWKSLRWCGPAIAFLLFMVPLPYRVQVALGGPLQQLTTQVSTFVLQALGLLALAEGNVIVLGEVRIGVVEACNGLTMLLTFFALSAGLALLLERRPLDRALILLSAVPVGVVANVLRITVTAALHVTVGSAVANAVFHDWAGWLMMPLALGLLWIELWLLARLFVAGQRPSPSAAGLGVLADPRRRGPVALPPAVRGATVAQGEIFVPLGR